MTSMLLLGLGLLVADALGAHLKARIRLRDVPGAGAKQRAGGCQRPPRLRDGGPCALAGPAPEAYLVGLAPRTDADESGRG